ncbi:hypothetical protein [Paraburkholderia dipogonis]|uniref:hypothetical protein n=1 Tax=Paraburkholderia dipogonis TaxID=1211383 RepID=UPI0038B8F53F
MKSRLKINLLLCTAICRVSVGYTVTPVATEDKFPVLAVDMGADCAISVIDYYGGHLASGVVANASYWTEKPPVPSTIEKFSLRFKCIDVQSSDGTALAYGAAWDMRGKRWKPYYEDNSERRLTAPVSRIYQVRSINATGFLRTTDQINGEEAQRVRFYSFCLFNGHKAVCGDGQSMRLREPQRDFLPYILRVLRSLSFIDSQSKTSNQ